MVGAIKYTQGRKDSRAKAKKFLNFKQGEIGLKQTGESWEAKPVCSQLVSHKIIATLVVPCIGRKEFEKSGVRGKECKWRRRRRKGKTATNSQLAAIYSYCVGTDVAEKKPLLL